MAMKSTKRKKFEHKLAALPKDQCTCFDCLRDMGLTPPRRLRPKHPRLYPATVMDATIDPETSGDQYGIPRPRTRRAKKAEAAQDAAKRSHLREAVRNREAV